MVSAEFSLKSESTHKEMKVIEHQRNNFFLLKADNSYFLDVFCSRSFASFTITIQLNESERTQYETQGSAYIEKLATTVNNQQDTYFKRRVDSATERQIHFAIMGWNNENPRS